MPFAATHILLPLILVALWRDFYLRKRDRSQFPLHYVLIAGLAGTLPDWDVAFFWILTFSGFDVGFWDIHKTYLHSFVVPVVFFILFLLTAKVRIPELGRHKLKLSIVFLMVAIGSLTHPILDLLLGEPFSPFLPIHDITIGFSFLSLFPEPLKSLFYPSLDAGLLILYLIYLEVKHKISDFI